MIISVVFLYDGCLNLYIVGLGVWDVLRYYIVGVIGFEFVVFLF